MKKRTALTMLTSCMMVAATAGTYAQWDKVTDSQSNTIGLDKPVIIKATQPTMSNNADTRQLDDFATVDAEATFNVNHVDKKIGALQIKPTVKGQNVDGSIQVSEKDFIITVEEKAADSLAPNTPLKGLKTDSSTYQDSTVKEGDATYIVHLVPKVQGENGGSKTNEEWDEVGDLTVTVQGTLVGTAGEEVVE
ncbi:MAG: hypothetical protein Q4D60_04210 [Eubacteriales bacterium]|nr:hypothetical protein [Eubacteriales bacterium]